MLDFNGIGIKSSEDLQEALTIEHSADQFCWQFQAMIDRWGLKNATQMLAIALCGNDSGTKPLIKFTQRYVTDDPGDMYEEPRLEKI